MHYSKQEIAEMTDEEWQGALCHLAHIRKIESKEGSK